MASSPVLGTYMHQSIKFRKGRPHPCGDTVIFVNFKMAAAAILDFPKLKNVTVGPLFGANIRHQSACQISSKWSGLVKESAETTHSLPDSAINLS